MCAPPTSISSELCSVPCQTFWRWWSLNLISKSCHFSFLGALQQSAFALFSIGLYSLGVEGVPPCQRHLQIPSIAQTGMPNYDLFSPLLSIRTFEEITIKHLMYTEKVPFLYTERACVVFSSFEICLGKVLI